MSPLANWTGIFSRNVNKSRLPIGVMKKRDYEKLADEISVLHVLITVISISAMVLIFYQPLKIYSAVWLASLWLIELVYGFTCPLTTKEYELRIKAGEKIRRKKFIPTFFKRYLKVNIPDWLAEVWLALYFIISIYVIVTFFI